MFSMLVIVLIFGTIVPMFTTLLFSKTAIEKDYHAYRVADYVLTKRLITKETSSGALTYDGETYNWRGNQQQLCVSYQLFNTKKDVCFRAQK